LRSFSSTSRRWTVIAAGLLITALGIVVIYTNRRAFSSPLAMLVVASIGFAAILLQVRLHRNTQEATYSPTWLNVLGTVFALGAVFGEIAKLSSRAVEFSTLAAIGCFGVAGSIMLEALRKNKTASGR
jgi:FtsH-binding integral membrane protein